MDQQNMNSENEYEAVFKPESASQKGRGFSIAALVLGIVGVCTSFIPIVNNAAFVLGVLAIIFGAVSFTKKIETKQAIVSIVLGILAIVITLIMQSMMVSAIDDAVDEFNNEMDYMSGDATEEILEKYLDVKFGKFQVIEGTYYDESKLEVTLKNTGTETASFNVEIEAVDAKGNRIDVDYVYVSDLGAGQSQKFNLFTLVSSDQYAQLKKATFKVVEVSKY